MKFLLPFLGIWSFGLIASMDLAQHGFEAIILAKQSSIPEMVHFPASKNIRRDLSYGILKTLPEMLNAGLDLIMMFNDHKLNGYEGASTEGDILHEFDKILEFEVTKNVRLVKVGENKAEMIIFQAKKYGANGPIYRLSADLRKPSFYLGLENKGDPQVTVSYIGDKHHIDALNKIFTLNEIRRLTPQNEVHFSMTRTDHNSEATKAVISLVLTITDDPHQCYFRLIKHIVTQDEGLRSVVKISLVLGNDDHWMILVRLVNSPIEADLEKLSFAFRCLVGPVTAITMVKKDGPFPLYASVRVPPTDIEVAWHANYTDPTAFTKVATSSDISHYLGTTTRDPKYCSYTMRRVHKNSSFPIDDVYSATISLPHVNRKTMFEHLMKVFVLSSTFKYGASLCSLEVIANDSVRKNGNLVILQYFLIHDNEFEAVLAASTELLSKSVSTMFPGFETKYGVCPVDRTGSKNISEVLSTEVSSEKVKAKPANAQDAQKQENTGKKVTKSPKRRVKVSGQSGSNRRDNLYRMLSGLDDIEFEHLMTLFLDDLQS